METPKGVADRTAFVPLADVGGQNGKVADSVAAIEERERVRQSGGGARA